MKNDNAIFLNLHVVPLLAVLMCFMGYLGSHGTYFFVHLTMLSLCVFFIYLIIFFLKLYYTGIKRILGISVYLVVFYIYAYSFYPALLFILALAHLHLFFLTKGEEIIDEGDLSQSILKISLQKLPKANVIIIVITCLSIFAYSFIKQNDYDNKLIKFEIVDEL